MSVDVHPLFLFLVLWVEPYWSGYTPTTDTSIYCYEWEDETYQLVINHAATIKWENGEMPEVLASNNNDFCEAICH